MKFGSISITSQHHPRVEGCIESVGFVHHVKKGVYWWCKHHSWMHYLTMQRKACIGPSSQHKNIFFTTTLRKVCMSTYFGSYQYSPPCQKKDVYGISARKQANFLVTSRQACMSTYFQHFMCWYICHAKWGGVRWQKFWGNLR